jgi:hypothetical protein
MHVHTTGACLQILNEVKNHAGLTQAAEFTEELINSTMGFSGNYNVSDFSVEDLTALNLLRHFYEQDQRQLHKLVNKLYPSSNFSVELES